jgi:DNA invertase Pin-like site-specific DNA recombinase
VYYDHFTGTKMDRPEFTKLMEVLKPGDTLKVTKLDRFARTAADGAIKIKELFERGVNVHVLNMGLIENTATGKLIMQIFLAFAEFEHDNIMERLNEGKAIVKAKNPEWREGRKAIEVDKAALDKFREAQKRGSMTVAECCRELGIGRSTWYNLCKRAG